MKRGEVWWADLPRPVGRRPVVLLSRDSAYGVRTSVTVAPVTRTIRGIPVEAPLDTSDGVPARCVVNLDDITTIPKACLASRLTTLSPENLAAVEGALRFALDLA
jgi:mRNA interferase MazF